MTKIDDKIFVEGNPHLTVLNGLYAAFDHFNKRAYSGDLLPTPVINLGPAGNRQALGWFGGERWIGEDAKTIHEINISPEFLDRKPDQVLETLLHEMAHMRNKVNDIDDCNAAQYHNKNFKDAAEYIGLEVEKDGYRGWSTTSLGQEGTLAIDSLPFSTDIFKVTRPHHKKHGKSKYIAIALKREDFEDMLEELGTEHTIESNSSIVKLALNKLHEEIE